MQCEKLVLLLQDLECGGTQRYAINLLRHIDRERFSPQLWVLREGLFYQEEIDNLAIEPKVLSEARRANPLSFYRLFKLLRQEKPHILYNLTVLPNVWGRMVGWLCKVPIIIGGYRNTYPAQLEWLLWRLSDRVICNAKALQDIMVKEHKVPLEHIRMVPNGVDTKLFAPKDEKKSERPIVLCAARYVAHKGQEQLIKIFSNVIKAVPKARLELVGEGPCRGDLERLVKRAGLCESVFVEGATEKIVEKMQKAWLFVLLSTDEGTANVLLEAQSTGLPVIANDVGGVAEIVEHGETGYLVDRENKEQISAMMIDILSDDRLRKSLGAKARRNIKEKYSLEKVVRQTEEVITELCQSLVH